MDLPGHPSYGSDGIPDSCRGCPGRDYPFAALLRLRFPACAAGTTGNVSWLCFLTDWHRINLRWLIWWTAAPPLRRGQPPARTHLGGAHAGRAGPRAALHVFE